MVRFLNDIIKVLINILETPILSDALSRKLVFFVAHLLVSKLLMVEYLPKLGVKFPHLLRVLRNINWKTHIYNLYLMCSLKG